MSFMSSLTWGGRPELLLEATGLIHLGSVFILVWSATALNESQQAEIVSALKERFGREVSIETNIDESLIGGAVIRAGDVVIDGSLRARLEGLANALVA